MSGLLYNIYINELPLLFNLLKDAEFNKNNNICKNIDHITVQFVDDSSNVIAFKDHNNIKSYTESYFNLLYDYYTANKLKFNPDKTKFIIICKKSMRYTFKNFKIIAKTYIIN